MSRQQPDREKWNLAAWRRGSPIEIDGHRQIVADRDRLYMGQNRGKHDEIEKIV